MSMKRIAYIMKTAILVMATVGLCACLDGRKAESKTIKRVTSVAKAGSTIRPFCACEKSTAPLIIKSDKVDDYLRTKHGREASQMDSTKVYDVVEDMPSFPGGPSKMFEFVEKNIRYPKAAEEEEMYGRVIVSFVVERTGELSNIKIVKSVSPSLDKEAIRVVKSMPRWNPGKQSGMKVRVKYTIPVTFRNN